MRLLPFAIAAAACGGFFVYAIMSTGLDTSRPASTLFNASVLLIVLGCLLTIAILFIGSRPFLALVLALANTSAWISGLALLASLLISALLMGNEGALMTHITQSGKFLVFVMIVLALLYGPQQLAATRKGNAWAPIFDSAQLALAPFVVLLLEAGNHSTLIEEIFCLWLGVMLGHNGYEMSRGESSFLNSLEQSEPHTESIRYPADSNMVRPMGIVIAASGLVLIVLAISGMLES